MKQTNKLRRKVLSTLLGSALLCGVAGIAAAEEAEETYKLDEVVVTASRIPAKLTETAANVTVITREDIEKGGFSSVTEALKNSNVVVQEQGGRSTDAAVPFLNGDKRVLVLVDGRRVTWEQNAVPGRFNNDLNLLPGIDNIERIEVVRGAASSLYGSDAVGGVINIITRKNPSGTTFTTEAGGWGLRKYNFTTGGNSGVISYSITARSESQDYSEYSDYRNGRTVKFPNTHSELEGLTLKLDKVIDGNHSLSFYADHLHTSGGMPVMTQGSALFSPDGFTDGLVNNVSLEYHWKQGENGEGNLRVYRNYYTQSKANISDGRGNYVNYRLTNRADGMDWNQNWQLGSIHTLVVGAEWRRSEVDCPDQSLRGENANYAVFLEDHWQMGHGWTITPGMRYDRYDMSGGKNTARVTVNSKLDDNTNIYVAWGQVFKAPAMDDLFTPDLGYSRGNPHLRPETGETVTLGINTQLKAGTLLQASVFTSRLNDAIAWDYSHYPWEPENIARQKKRGADITLKHPLSPQWDITAGYSYLKLENKNKGELNYKPDISNNQPNGYHVGVQYHQDAWNVSMTGRGASGRSRETFTSASYFVLDLAASYRINPAARVYVKAYNLTNEAYELKDDVAKLGISPMPARQWIFGLEYRM